MSIDDYNSRPRRPEANGLTVQKGGGETLYHLPTLRNLAACDAIGLAAQAPKMMSDLSEKTAEAADVLDESVKRIGGYLETFKPMKKDVIDELRGLRMTTTTEVAAMLKPLEDVRQFFLGKDHEAEVARLREFVDLCERLQKLKQSGFLDTVADTMLKLS
jgi:hypothetical protein